MLPEAATENLLLVSEEVRHSMPNLARTSIHFLESIRSSWSLESDLQVPSSQIPRTQQWSAGPCEGPLCAPLQLIPFCLSNNSKDTLRGLVSWVVLTLPVPSALLFLLLLQLGAIAVLFRSSSSSLGRLELVIETLEVAFQTQPHVLSTVWNSTGFWFEFFFFFFYFCIECVPAPFYCLF